MSVCDEITEPQKLETGKLLCLSALSMKQNKIKQRASVSQWIMQRMRDFIPKIAQALKLNLILLSIS